MVESTNPDYWNAHWTAQGFPSPSSLTPAAKAILDSKNPADRVMQTIAAMAGGNPAVQAALDLHINSRPKVPANAEPFLESEESQPVPTMSDAILRLGQTALYRLMFFPLIALCSGTGIVGQIVRGKTHLAQGIAVQAVMLGGTVIVIDFKGTWRRLLRIPAIASRSIVLSSRDLRVSIGQPPPGCDRMDWWSVVVDCWGSAFGRLRAHQLLLNCMQACYTASGGSHFFKLSELLAYARTLAQGPRNYETELARGLVESLDNMHRNSGPMFEVNGSDMIERMMSTPGKLIIINEGRSGFEHTQFMVAYLMNWVYRFRRSNRELADLQHIIIFLLEDASNLLGPKLDENTVSGTSPIASVQDVCREFKIGLMPVFHSLRSLSPKIGRNLNNWFSVGIQGEDADVAKRVMGLTNLQAETLLRLGNGEAVGLVPSVNPRPVFFTYPMLEVPDA